MNGLAARVPAKVNLYLRVGRRRKDGYHSILTLYHSIGLWDEIRIFRSSRFSFSVSGIPVPRGRKNLCVRAWRLIRESFPAAERVRIHLIKRIPPRAGLGGGSADAAACLAGLNRFLRLGLKARDLGRLAARLGSDVPFFLACGAAIAKGRGERLKRVRSRLNAWAAGLKPGFGSSTGGAYRALDLARKRGCGCDRARNVSLSSGLPAVLRAVAGGRPAALAPQNDFQEMIAGRHPGIRRLLRALAAGGASPAFLTGSGSAVIGVFPSRRRAEAAARRLARRLRVDAFAAPLKPLKMALIPLEGCRARRRPSRVWKQFHKPEIRT